jgi:prepilin-type N-terminal cleavage/methylation domain-containing protein
MRRTTRRAGFNLVEMMVVVLIIGVLVALFMLAVTGARQSGSKVRCQSNIRQLGFGFAHYVTDAQVLPSIHTNIWASVGVYVGQRFNATSDAAYAANQNSDIGEVYRCPLDAFRRNDSLACSYAPNCQEAPANSATGPGGADQFNARYSPWSNYKLDAAKVPIADLSRLLNTRTVADAAPDTVLLVECWNQTNVIDVTHYLNWPMPALGAYLMPGNVPAPAARPLLASATDAGTYRFMAAFGQRAQAGGRTASVQREVFHSGSIAAFYADQHAELSEATYLTQKPPVHWPPFLIDPGLPTEYRSPNRPPPGRPDQTLNAPVWTREAD